MSKDQVFQTTKVRTSLKNDSSWLLKSKRASEERDDARTQEVQDHRPVLQKRNSYVMSAAKKFEPQLPTEEIIKNGQAQPDQPVAIPAAESNGGSAHVAIDLSNAAQKEEAAEVSADVPGEGSIQNGEAQPILAAKENPEAPVEPAQQTDANTKENQSNGEQNEAIVSADAHVEDPVAEICAAAATEGSKDSAEAPAELKPEEEPTIQTEITEQPAEESCPPEQAVEEVFQAVAAVVIETSDDKSDAIKATPGEEAAIPDNVEPVSESLAESVSESPAQPAAETTVVPVEANVESVEASVESVEANVESVEAKVESVEAKVESVEAKVKSVEAKVESVEAKVESVEAKVEPVEEKAESVEDKMEPVECTVVESVECKVESVTPAEPVLENRVEEAVVPVVEQSVEPAPESAADRAAELSIEDALDPSPASEPEASEPGASRPEAALDDLASRVIPFTHAVDVEPSPDKAAAEPPKDPEQTHTEDTNLNQQSDTNTSEMSQKHVEEPGPTKTPVQQIKMRNGNAVCTFCDNEIDGNVKITFDEPLVCCHPDCLKCGVCALALGDMLIPMFLHSQMIQCGGCFAKTL